MIDDWSSFSAGFRMTSPSALDDHCFVAADDYIRLKP
jgi:hypothetical protein